MNSQNYWRKREEEALKHYIKDEKEYSKRITKIHEDMLKACQNEINDFYARYANKEGITIQEAKKRVTSLEIKEYEKKAKEYVEAAEKDRKTKGKTDPNAFYFSDKANEEMRLYNATMRINRLEMLKANIGLEMIKGHEELDKFMGDILKGRTMDELKRQAGILGKTIVNNAKGADAIVNASFHNATFSDRIWMYQDLMKADLSKMLQSGLIQGKGARELTKGFKQYLLDPKKGAASKVLRLMQTELARVQTEAARQSFVANGFEQFEFIANSGCCDICQAINGKHFDVKKLMPGENAPPMHPNCRCAAAPYEDSQDYEAWLNHLEKGGTTESWLDFKNNGAKVVEKQKQSAKMKVEKSEIRKLLEKSNVKYKEVEYFKEQPTESQIINRLCGGDLTSGSCSSLGFAYIGNKNGLDVLDFRGGSSQKAFREIKIIKEMLNLQGVKGEIIKVKKEAVGAMDVISKLEKNKEYYFTSGKHAAIVKVTEDDAQYLELQSATENGWISFNDYGSMYDTLVKRFGCRKTVDKMKIGRDTLVFEKEVVIMEVDSFKDNEEFRKILGYINTDEDKQKKGVSGNVK